MSPAMAASCCKVQSGRTPGVVCVCVCVNKGIVTCCKQYLILTHCVCCTAAGRAGADCMGLMARAARMAARQGREAISEDDIYAAMENKAMEAYAVRSHTLISYIVYEIIYIVVDYSIFHIL